MNVETLKNLGIFVEKLQIAYEKEIDSYVAMHTAYDNCYKTINEHNECNACVALIRKLDLATSIKHQNAVGAQQALQLVVSHIKELYDAELNSVIGKV